MFCACQVHRYKTWPIVSNMTHWWDLFLSFWKWAISQAVVKWRFCWVHSLLLGPSSELAESYLDSQGCWSQAQLLLDEGEVNNEQVPSVFLNLWKCFWTERKPECSEKTHTCTDRTCNFHTERTQPGFKSEPSCRETRVLPITPPCSPYSINIF